MEETFKRVAPVESGKEKRSKGSREAKSPLRGHITDKDCYIKISKELSMHCGETEHWHSASFMQASLLCLTVLQKHLGPTLHSGLHPQSLCRRIAECS